MSKGCCERMRSLGRTTIKLQLRKEHEKEKVGREKAHEKYERG
jgi:hypothetical protein